MGKPFASELESLGRTYNWAMTVDIVDLADAVCRLSTLPLFVTGSGGSLTTAQWVVQLHQRYAHRLAKAVTPLELSTASHTLRETAVLFLSAGGRNNDINGALKMAILEESPCIAVFSNSPGSPITELARRYEYVDLIELGLPFGSDGFLATNSLLASCVMLTRAYEMAFSREATLPSTFEALLSTSSAELLRDALREACTPVWTRQTLAVLYGPTGQAAAVDLESKFSEAALGSVHLADYRNFAHGRHHWLAKRGSSSAVLALVTADDRQLALRTLQQVPPDIPVARIETTFDGPRAGIALLVSALYLTGLAGTARGIDPGDPGVPLFGRRLYSLQAFSPTFIKSRVDLSPDSVAIRRKTGVDQPVLAAAGKLDWWRAAFERFVAELGSTRFRALVVDYDGTLCGRSERFVGLRASVVDHLQRLLEADILIAIATGRGKSAKEALRGKIDQRWWNRVIIGYYNGAEIALLNDDHHPHSTDGVSDALMPLMSRIRQDVGLSRLARVTYRSKQITVEPNVFAFESMVWDSVEQLTALERECGISVLRSSHSVDILAPGVSKMDVVRALREMIGDETPSAVLCIGDRGRWPGNDFALLSERCSLSVDEVSSDVTSCWNLAPPGHRGVQALLDYLSSIDVRHRSLQVHVKRLLDWRNR